MAASSSSETIAVTVAMAVVTVAVAVPAVVSELVFVVGMRSPVVSGGAETSEKTWAICIDVETAFRLQISCLLVVGAPVTGAGPTVDLAPDLDTIGL